MISDFSSPRVLVVEDHPDTADLLARYAGLLGCNVRIAVDGESAVEMSLDFLPQIVLLDIGLPDMDGWEVARILRKQLEPIHPVLIAVTCFRGHEDQMRSKAVGIDHHLLKPDFRQDLMRLLMPLVGRA
jgi:CheY-like chemotaxis protein